MRSGAVGPRLASLSPDTDVAAAGGWHSLDALKRSYQQVDADTLLTVVMGAGQLREAK